MMDDSFVRVILLIFSVLWGVFHAHMLGVINSSPTEMQEDGLNTMLVMLGKETLKEKKRSLYKSSLLTWILYIPYASLAFYYFYGENVPFTLMLFLTFIILIDYIYGMKEIKSANDLKEVGNIDRFQKSNMVLNVVIVAIITGYLI